MDERAVGASGLRVSALGLGTMTWGRDTGEDDARELLEAFVEAGGSLVDTSAAFGNGAAEEVLGGLLGTVVDRRDVVLASKAGIHRGAAGTYADASRGAMLDALDDSLRRLGTDHLDLWLVQRWDAETPLDETLGALEHAVSTGRTRYVGVSNFSGWQTARAVSTSRVPLVATEVEYSLVQRGAEREVLPACAELGVGVLAWSPLGRGVLTGKYRRGTPADSRAAAPHLAGFVTPYLEPRARGIVDAVATAADGLGCAPLDVALAWVRDRPGVAGALLGSRTAAQLRAALAAESLVLPAEIRSALDEVGAPVMGYPERAAG